MEFEVNAKAQKIDEPGETVEEITFTEEALNPLNSVDLGIHEQKLMMKYQQLWKLWVNMMSCSI